MLRRGPKKQYPYQDLKPIDAYWRVQCMPSADVAASWTLFSRSSETIWNPLWVSLVDCHMFFWVSLSLIFCREKYRRSHLLCWCNYCALSGLLVKSLCLSLWITMFKLVWFNEFRDVDPNWSFCEIRCVFLVFDPFLSKENRSKLNLPQQNDQAKKNH